MYILTFHTANLGYYERFCKVNPREDFRLSILDTDDFTEDEFTKAEFEALLKEMPNIQVQGLRHNSKVITELYGFGNNTDIIVEGNLAMQYEQKTNRGSYCTLKFFVKGIDACIYKVDTPHVEGRYDWDIRFMCYTPQGYAFKIGLRYKGRYIALNTGIRVKVVGDKVNIIEFFDDKEISQY